MKLYPTRGAVPYPLWLSLFSDAKERIDVLAYAGLFLLDTHPELAHLIASRARSGVAVRLLLGDPDSDAVRRRGEEEGIGEAMEQRCRLALRYLDPALNEPRVELRLHETTLYNSIYRGDDVALVNQHMYGTGAPAIAVNERIDTESGSYASHKGRDYDVMRVAIHSLHMRRQLSKRHGGHDAEGLLERQA